MIQDFSHHSSPKVKSDLASHLEFFVLLARHGNLSAAARALDLTPPAATKRLAQLEEGLGVRLVNRTTRTSSLTPEGETYLHYATRILAELREMEDAVAATRSVPRGRLAVNASLGFGRTAIAPIVSGFAARYPQVEVQLDLSDRPVDLVADGVDLAIRFGAPRYVDSGRLAVVLPQFVQPAADLFVVYPNRQHQSARTRVFIDFLVEQLGPGSGARIRITSPA